MLQNPYKCNVKVWNGNIIRPKSFFKRLHTALNLYFIAQSKWKLVYM